MPIVLFRSRLKAGADMAALQAVGERMDALVREMPGFMAYRDYAAADGELLTVVEFRDDASLQAWRDHPEHKAAQQRGRREFFSEYRIQVCSAQREYSFPFAEPLERI